MPTQKDFSIFLVLLLGVGYGSRVLSAEEHGTRVAIPVIVPNQESIKAERTKHIQQAIALIDRWNKLDNKAKRDQEETKILLAAISCLGEVRAVEGIDRLLALLDVSFGSDLTIPPATVGELIRAGVTAVSEALIKIGREVTPKLLEAIANQKIKKEIYPRAAQGLLEIEGKDFAIALVEIYKNKETDQRKECLAAFLDLLKKTTGSP